MSEAVPVPDTDDPALVALALLRTAEGTAAAQRAAGLMAEGVDLLPGLSRLRDELGPALAGPAWELARLRARARPVFGADADSLFLTAETLEQAGRPELAARRAPRLVGGAGCSAAASTRWPTWAAGPGPTP